MFRRTGMDSRKIADDLRVVLEQVEDILGDVQELAQRNGKG